MNASVEQDDDIQNFGQVLIARKTLAPGQRPFLYPSDTRARCHSSKRSLRDHERLGTLQASYIFPSSSSPGHKRGHKELGRRKRDMHAFETASFGTGFMTAEGERSTLASM
jgi:hypothetical protein